MKNVFLLILVFKCFLLNGQIQSVNYKMIFEYSEITAKEFLLTQQITTERYSVDLYKVRIGMFAIEIATELRNNLWQEFELMPISYSQEDHLITIGKDYYPIVAVTGERISNLYSYFNYSLHRKLYTNEKFELSVGITERLYLDHVNVKPKISSSFPKRSLYLGLLTGISFSTKWDISEKVFIKMKIPFYLLDYHGEFGYVEDPQLSSSERKHNNSDIALLPKIYGFDLGLGIKIN